MSFRNVYYDRKKNKIHLWHTVNGERLYDVYDWVPYVYIKTDKNTSTKSIYGHNVIRKKFKNYFEYKKFQENNDCEENKVMPEIQFLAEHYHKIPDDKLEVPNLKIYSLDIETYSFEFPLPCFANDPIVLISLYDTQTDKVYVFGDKEYSHTEINEDSIYYHYTDEKELLNKICNFIHDNPPDVITGWNIIPSPKLNVSGFDMGYMINRIKNLFGSDTNVYKKLSPINVVTTREDNDRNVHVDIAGITLIDYLTAYKWYSRENPESYTLEYISNLELGTGKLQYKGSLHELYENDYNKMVDYNIIDTKRVKQLEEKLSFIKLIQTIGLMSNCPMKHYIAMTNVIEGKMLTYFRRNNLCAPKFEGGREQQPYEGAYVKDPHKGLHRWIASIDIASSYPSHIITLNMSVESYVGRIISFTEDDVVRYTSKKEFPEFEMFRFNTKKTDKFDDNKLKRFNLMLQKGLIAIAPCGTCFKTKPEGVMAHVERDMFFYRKSIKKKMKEETDKNKLKQLDLSQLAQKVALNSFYGLTATIYTRYHNSDISKAITSCARHTIKQGEKFGNELLNNPNDKLKLILKELS